MIKKSPIRKPYYYDTKDGIDYFTKLMVEENPKKLSDKEKQEIHKLGRDMKKAALDNHIRTVKPMDNLDPKSYLSDPLQRGKILEIDKLEKDLNLAPPKPKKSVNYLSNNYSFAENFKKQSKNINNYKPTTTANKPFKTVRKVEVGEPVKIDFKLDPMPMHTAGLWSNIKNSSLYKLLDHPHPMGVELGYEGIMEVYNLLQNSGLLKKGGRVK